jgi:hypothetical protein
MIEWARHETPLVGAKETLAFVDYWLGVPGAKGVKANWLATWRNWMRRSQASAEQGRASPSTAPQRVPKAERCPEHPNERAADCGGCRARALAKPREDP